MQIGTKAEITGGPLWNMHPLGMKDSEEQKEVVFSLSRSTGLYLWEAVREAVYIAWCL